MSFCKYASGSSQISFSTPASTPPAKPGTSRHRLLCFAAYIIHGRHDKLISITHELAALAGRFSNYEIIEMKHAGHYPHIEEADKVLVFLKEKFLAPDREAYTKRV